MEMTKKEIRHEIKVLKSSALAELNIRKTGVEAGRQGIKRSLHLYKIPDRISKEFKSYIKTECGKAETVDQAKLVYEKAYVLALFCDFGHVLNRDLIEKIQSFEEIEPLYQWKRTQIR